MAARNVEIKASAPDLAAIRHRASAIAPAPAEFISQIDTFFLVQHGRLKVREFDDGSGELIAYDRADRAGPKTSNYTVVSCEDAGALCEALSRVLPVRGRVVKRRQLFLIGRTRVHLDEVERLGTFVELEVVLADGETATDGEAEARELMRRLDIAADALIAKAYIDLLEESRHGCSGRGSARHQQEPSRDAHRRRVCDRDDDSRAGFENPGTHESSVDFRAGAGAGPANADICELFPQLCRARRVLVPPQPTVPALSRDFRRHARPPSGAARGSRLRPVLCGVAWAIRVESARDGRLPRLPACICLRIVRHVDCGEAIQADES